MRTQFDQGGGSTGIVTNNMALAHQFGYGKRANMPWWGGFDPRALDKASLMDWLVPAVTCAAVYLIAR